MPTFSRSSVLLLVLLVGPLSAPVLVHAAPQKGKSAKTATVKASKGTGLAAPVTLTDGKRVVRRTRQQLGFVLKAKRKGRPIFAANPATLKVTLKAIAPAFAQPATDAQPFVYKGRLAIRPGAKARSLAIGQTAQGILRVLRKNPDATKFKVVLSKKSGPVSDKTLRGMNGVIGTFTTEVSDTDKRNHNIALAVQRINGTLVAPGATFSLNKKVGPRTQANGFLTAHVFQNAKVIAGIGGGVSQVTGTLFNAAALANLKITEVHPHSRPVSYLPIGRDATVSDTGGEDFKFVNDSGAPVYITYSFDRKHLRVTLFGRRKPGRTVALRPVVQKLGPGKVNAQLFRVVKEKGRVVSKGAITKHEYRWSPQVDAKQKQAQAQGAKVKAKGAGKR